MTECVDLGPNAGAEKINYREFASSLTGFEEIAVQRSFGHELDELGKTILARALLFIQAKRDGAKDADAYRTVMNLRLDQVEDRFRTEPAEEMDEGKESGPTPTS